MNVFTAYKQYKEDYEHARVLNNVNMEAGINELAIINDPDKRKELANQLIELHNSYMTIEADANKVEFAKGRLVGVTELVCVCGVTYWLARGVEYLIQNKMK